MAGYHCAHCVAKQGNSVQPDATNPPDADPANPNEPSVVVVERDPDSSALGLSVSDGDIKTPRSKG